MLDKKHWYDGFFYDKFIAPNQDKIYNKIEKIIPNESTLLDFGCGTGRLSFRLADKCKRITAIDLSVKNITFAKSKQSLLPKNNLSFLHDDTSILKAEENILYDYAVISYVIHEIPERDRVDILKELKSFSKRLIISDYISPIPHNGYGLLTYVVEYLAGSDHYKNFKNYVKNGGIKSLADKADLKIIRQISNRKNSMHLAVLE